MSEVTARRRLAIVVPSAYPLGGVQTWLDYLVHGLDDAVWDTTVVLPNGAHSDANQYLRHHPFKAVRVVSNPTGSREGRVRALANVLRDLAPELVLSVNIADTYDAVIRLRKREGSSARVAMALHGLEACYFRDIERHRETIDAVIVTNRLAEVVTAQLCGYPQTRTRYAPCGVEVPPHPRPEAIRDDLTLIFAGRFENEEKRVMDLPAIAAALARRMVPFRLRLAGAGPAEAGLRAALAPYAASVEFLGPLDAQAMRAVVYQPGAILLILSPQESGPLVAWEAVANGVAIVTSQFVGIGRESGLVSGVNCLSFPTGDVEAAADAILRMRDSTLRRDLVVNGYDTAKRRYSREASIETWSRALVEVLGHPPRSAISEDVAPPSGRLDRILGVQFAETARQMIGISYRHTSVGGEWPHSYGVDDNPDFRAKIVALDRV